jgi:hypothetical protein
MLSDAIGVAEVGSLVSVSFVKIDGLDLCRVDVQRSSREVFARTSQADSVVFVRTGAATRQLSTKEAMDYVKQHWPSGRAKAVSSAPSVPLVQEAHVSTTPALEDIEEGSAQNGDLEQRFHRAMVGVYQRAKSEAGYNATRFLQMVAESGGLEAARTLLASTQVSDGFTALWEAKRLDLSVEALVLDSEWRDLFTDQERDVARRRLRDYGYEV